MPEDEVVEKVGMELWNREFGRYPWYGVGIMSWGRDMGLVICVGHQESQRMRFVQ